MTNFAQIFTLKSDQLTPPRVFRWGVRNEEFRWPANYGEAPRHHWDEIIFMTLSSYKKRVLAHFENNLDFKATHEFTLIWSQPWFKKTVWHIFKTTLISRQFEFFITSHSWILNRVWILSKSFGRIRNFSNLFPSKVFPKRPDFWHLFSTKIFLRRQNYLIYFLLKFFWGVRIFSFIFF